MGELYRLDQLTEFQCGLCGCNAFTLTTGGEVICDACEAIAEDLIVREVRQDGELVAH